MDEGFIAMQNKEAGTPDSGELLVQHRQLIRQAKRPAISDHVL